MNKELNKGENKTFNRILFNNFLRIKDKYSNLSLRNIKICKAD